MKKKFAVLLTAVLAMGSASSVFASDVLEKAYEKLAKAQFDSKTTGYVLADDADYKHAVPVPFEFKSGALGAKIADFDGDGADELLVFYAANKIEGNDLFYAQMLEEKNGEAVLGGESAKIENFLSGEKGGGCAFVKKVNGKDRIFMQYTGEINSYADGADYSILGLDYDGEGFKTAFEYKGAGSMISIPEEEANSFKEAGLTDTFAFFNPYENEEGKTEYGFSPYYGDFGGFNIGALEKDKDLLVDITVKSNYEDVIEKAGSDWEKHPDLIAKDGVITLDVKENVELGSDTKADTKEDTKADTKAEEKPAAEEKASDEIPVYLNGEKMTFDSEPYIEKGTTRVPMRAIFEGLGAVVDFDGETKTVTATKGDSVIKLTIGSVTASINGVDKELIVAPEIKNDRTMVPLRFVSESLGAKVDWNGETRTITITQEESAKEEAKEETKEEVKEEVKEEAADISGTYVQKLTDELDGKKVDIEYSITLNADKTGVMSIQDDIPVTWTEDSLVTADGTKYAYTVANGVLTVDFVGEKSEFTKK